MGSARLRAGNPDVFHGAGLSRARPRGARVVRDTYDDDDDQRDDRKSKSQAKREMLALQELGARLAALPAQAIRSLPAPDDLKEALIFAKGLTKHEAVRRQMQFIGRLMRETDPQPLQDRLTEMTSGSAAQAREFKEVEALRDELVALAAGPDPEALDLAARQAAERTPGLNPAELAHLARDAAAERAKQKPPKAFRSLFRLLRRAREASGE